jgi:hypothetical protein
MGLVGVMMRDSKRPNNFSRAGCRHFLSRTKLSLAGGLQLGVSHYNVSVTIEM